MAKESRKPGSGSKTDNEPDRRLKKATDRPVGQPERAREEAPIGWDFGPDGPPLDTAGDVPGGRVNIAEDEKAVDETPTASVQAPEDEGSENEPGGTQTSSDGGDQAAGTDDPASGGVYGYSDNSFVERSVGPQGRLYPQDAGPGTAVGGGPGGINVPDLGGGPPGPGGSGGGTDEGPGSPGGGTDVRPPEIAGPAAGDVQEDVVFSVSGQLTASGSGGVTWSLVGDGDSPYGSLILNPDGSWSYALDNDADQGLRAGDTAQEIFTVKVTDAAGAEATQTITVTIRGTNDVPVISGSAVGSAEEDGTLTAGGKLDVSDADIGDIDTWSIVGDGDGAYGSLALNPDGSWSYALDNDAAQGLKAGDTAQEIFTVKVADSAGAEVTQTVTVTVTGTNDAPVISGTATGSVAEDGTLTAGGKLDVSDADIGDTATWSVVGGDTGSYGSLTLNPDGSWSYALDNDAAQGLKAGDAAQEIVTVKVTDAAGAEVTQTITVTVTGTNDVPVISGAETGAVQEDGTLTAGGKLDVSDADIGDTATWSMVGGDTGSYGSLTLNPDGSWSYALDNDAAQGLKAGDTAQEIFTVKVTDSAGAEVTQTVTVTVAGTNDVPVISGTATGSVQEDEALTASGTLTASDADIGDTATWSVVGAGDGAYGSLTLNPDGSWSYALDNDAAQGLKAGDTAQEIFTVKVTDSAGAEVTQTITVTVTGTNDVPVISGTETGAVQEDSTLTAGGTLTASDADIGDTATWSVVGDGDGAYGSLTLNPDGSWSYALDNDAAQGLKAGDTAQEIFTVKVTDAAGAEVTQTVTVTVTGTNDVPVISGTATGSIEEDGTLTAGGKLDVSDADIGDTATWSVMGDGDGAYGSLTLNPDGSWSYALDNDAAQGLKAGDTAQEIFTVKVMDAAGAEVTQTVTVTVAGTNDVPVISGAATGTVQEDEALTASGTLTASDADIGDTATWSVVGAGGGAYGSLTLNPDGSWSYALDNDAAQSLKAGDTAQEIFTVKVTDSAGAEVTQTVTVTVTGTNDMPVISGTATGSVNEDGTLTVGGKLDVSDVDIGDTATWFVVGSSAGQYGGLVLGDDGHWSYALDNDADQGLRAGDMAQEIFTVKVKDTAGAEVTQTVTVTVTGTNDVPVISGTATGSVQEDGTLTAGGKLDVADADIGDIATWSMVGGDTGSYGSLTLNPDGSWSYALDNDAAQGLKAGDTAQEIFTVKVTDTAGAEVTQTVTVKVTGTNDVPVISGVATGTVQEDETLSASGTLTASDADIGDTATWSVVGDGGVYGSLNLNPDGSWSYALDNDAAQSLKAGDTAQEIFTVKVTDAAGAEVTQTVTVTVTGTNDVPVISGTETGAVQEDGTLTAGGTLTASDVDIGDTATWSVVGDGDGAYGSLTLNPDGSWSYALDNDAAQGLKAGDTAQEIFTVKVTDAAGAEVAQTVTVTVTGTNDVPVISGTESGTVQEDEMLTASGTLTAGDTDIDDTATWSVIGDGDGSYGSLTVKPDGSWSYTLDNDAAQGLKAGDTAQEIFTVKVTDAAGAEVTQTVTVTVAGTNDVPVISGTATGSVAEDGTLTAGGKLDVSDADIGDTATWSVVGDGEGSYGSLTLNPDGSWSYALDNDAAQGLKVGDTAQEIFTVKETDAAGAEVTQTVTVTVTGTNDVPTISGTETGAVQEDELLTASGALTSNDADIGDTAAWSVIGSLDGSYGSLALDPNGTWSYALDNDAADELKAGETAQEIFTVKVTDASGASDTQTVTITVTGTNDAPVISGTATGSVEEDGTLTAGGKLEVLDVDTGDTATWSVVGGDTGSYGSLSIDESGRWSYTLDNNKAQGLKAGETAQETFTVRVTDSEGANAEQTITITVGGTNDVPVISGTSTGQVQEDVTLTASGTFTAADADVGDTAAWSIDGAGDSAHGVFAIDPDTGHWTFTLDNDTAQSLKAGEVIRETFTVRATDSAGASETHLVSVEITGTNDGPQVGQALNNMGSMKEDTSLTFSADDLLRGAQVTDIDRDHLTITTVGLDGSSAPGKLVDNGNGTWTFTPNENVSNANAEIVFQVSDGHKSVSAQASVAIQPVADPADVSISSSAMQEVIKTGPSNDLGRIVAPQITTKQLTEFTLEFTVVGNSVPESTTGAGPVIVNIGSPPSDKNTLTLWDPANMKVGMSKLGGGDINIPTGIDLTDGQSHRVTVTWDAKTNSLKVYDNGDLALTTQLPKPLPNTLYLAVAEKANTPPTTGNPAGGGYRANEHFEGTIFNVAMSNKAETASQVKEAPLAEQMDDNNLLIDLRAQNDKIVDTTGRNSIKTGGAIDTDALTVDTDLGAAPVGSVVHLDIDAKLGDPNDAISHLVISGFVAGTVVSDGVHSVTVGGPTQTVDITKWSLGNLTADLPDGVRTSMDLKVTATTTTPPYETGQLDAQGQPVMATDSTTTETHDTLLVEGAGPPPATAADAVMATATALGSEETGASDTIAALGSALIGAGAVTSEEAPASSQQPAKAGVSAEGDSTTTAPESSTGTNDGSGTAQSPDSDAGTSADGTTTIAAMMDTGSGERETIAAAGTEQPISTGSGTSGETPAGTGGPPTVSAAQPDGTAVAAGPSSDSGMGTEGGETTTGAQPPLSTVGGETNEATSTVTAEPPTAASAQPDGSAVTVDPASHGDVTNETAAGTQPPTTGAQMDSATNGTGSSAIDSAIGTHPLEGGSGDSGAVVEPPVFAGDVAGSEIAAPVANEAVNADGQISLVSVNDWYNPSWGGGYNATFQLTLSDDMLKDGSIEGWNLQIGVHNPNAVISTGWLDGFNGTVSFDPSSGTFTNAGQEYQPELHAGDTIQFSIQVQNSGFSRDDFSFSFRDLDPVPDVAAGSGDASAGTMAQHADTSVNISDAHDVSDTQTLSAVAEFGTHETAASTTDGHGPDQSASHTGPADQGASDPAVHDQPLPSAASAYLDFVQPRADDHASAGQPVDQQPSGADEYLHMVGGTEQAGQEPPPPDHLFADAQIEHSPASGTDTQDEQHDTHHDDAAAAAASSEPSPLEEDQHHHHQ